MISPCAGSCIPNINNPSDLSEATPGFSGRHLLNWVHNFSYRSTYLTRKVLYILFVLFLYIYVYILPNSIFLYIYIYILPNSIFTTNLYIFIRKIEIAGFKSTLTPLKPQKIHLSCFRCIKFGPSVSRQICLLILYLF